MGATRKNRRLRALMYRRAFDYLMDAAYSCPGSRPLEQYALATQNDYRAGRFQAYGVTEPPLCAGAGHSAQGFAGATNGSPLPFPAVTEDG